MIKSIRNFSLVAMTVMMLTTSAFGAEHTKDTLAVVKANIEQEKAVFVDVREVREWNAGHLEGALFVPLSRLQKGVDPKSLDKRIDKQKILYTHCKAGGRCLVAAEILQKLGYQVRPLKQGTQELIDSGFPAAKKKE